MAIKHIYKKATALGLKKTREYLDSPDACRLRRGDNVGVATRYKKGNVPANKGTKRPGYSIGRGRMAETTFKKGEKTSTWLPIGSTRLMDGYQQRKMTDTGYPPKDWVGVHILLWQELHGPIPAGHVVVFKDGNKEHIEFDNLELLCRADLMRRNSIQNLPKPLKEVIQLNGALKRKINGK
ncbi:MAG: HNH endonuclease [Pseudomonadota bacterium]|nr:HNH endonuclease [Pseudomonadota bacterium]